MTRWLLGLGVLLTVAACAPSGPSPSASGTATATPVPPATASAVPTATPVPVASGFSARSVTFVSQSTGFVLGVAQCSSGACVAVARTTDGGHTWSGVPAPSTTYANNVTTNTGVHSIRFATPNDGWIFGPELWSTHDGGAHWTKQEFFSGTGFVWALEAAHGTANAAVYSSQSGPKIFIDTTPVTSDSWQAAQVNFDGVGAGPVPQLQMVLQGSSGWVVLVNRTVVGGSRLSGGTWSSWTPPCSSDNGAVTLAGLSDTSLSALCQEGTYGSSADSPGWHEFQSGNAGASFQPGWATLPMACCVGQFATASATTAVVATTDGGLHATFDGGQTWASVSNVAVDADLGFTTPTQGVGIDDQSGTLVMTDDGGHTWAKVAI